MNTPYKRSLIWLRRDLRLHDNTALCHASKRSQFIQPIFIFDKSILDKLTTKNDRRVSFIYDSLIEIEQELKEMGGQLIIRYGDPLTEITEVAKTLQVDAIFFNEDYEPKAKIRDQEIERNLGESYAIHSYKDQVIFSGDEVLKGDSTPYRVFTPYFKAWTNALQPSFYKEQKCLPTPLPNLELPDALRCQFSLKDIGFEKTSYSYSFQQPGRDNGLKQLDKFEASLCDYGEKRDVPSHMGTSGLSVHLRFGTLSIRECVRKCKNRPSNGAYIWLKELVWREFYQMILDNFPEVDGMEFQEKYRNIPWTNNESYIQAWKKGETGFPIIDAAMRELNETGWMHNRLRMIVASFFVKDLLCDWRIGEQYFAETLLDYDLASNNGGWQWSASTGCDAQPYFRIFNPILQQKKFDPQGEYIHRWVPEWNENHPRKLEKQLPLLTNTDKSYPMPIVDHKKQKEATIQLFKMKRIKNLP